MGLDLSQLQTPPPAVDAAAELIAGLDGCLLLGFARLGPPQHEALAALAGAFAGTPLAGPVDEARAAVRRSEFVARHFCVLAAARAAVQGAQYDALLAQARAALGRPAPPAAGPPPRPLSGEGRHAAWLASTQQWLMELALAGFNHLAVEALTPFMATLEQMQAEPSLARLAALLTGFLTELLAETPRTSDEAPIFRWADLWTRALVAAQAPPVPETGTAVAGTLRPLGVDVRTHAHFVNLVVHGLFASDGQRRLVRVPLSHYKADVISQREVWQLFRPAADPLLEALAGARALEVAGMNLLPGGDLLWTGKARVGAPHDPLATGAEALTPDVAPLPPEPPLTRHPVQLAELVTFASISVRPLEPAAALGRANGDEPALELVADGRALPLATERLRPGSELDAKTLASATGLVGLLRFDRGAWAVQPLCARVKPGKKESLVMSGSGALEFCKKDKRKTLAVLSERAGKLLRQ